MTCVWERVMSWASSVNLILWLLSEVLVYVRMLTVCRFTRGARHRFCFCRASADIFFEFRRENSTADATRSWRIPVGDLALFWHISWKNDKVADERIDEKSGMWSNSLIFKGYVHLIRLLSSKMGGSLRTHVTILLTRNKLGPISYHQFDCSAVNNAMEGGTVKIEETIILNKRNSTEIRSIFSPYYFLL